MIHVCTMCGIRNICTMDEPSLDCLRVAMEIEERKKKPKTNADKIRNLTDEELAEFLHLTNDCCCDYVMKRRCPDFDKCGVECWLDWLKEEVKK